MSRTRELEKVIKNLNKEIKKIERVTQKGLLNAGFFIKSETLPGTPIKTGNLRGSGYIIWSGGTDNVEGNFRGKDSAKMKERHRQIITRRKGILDKTKRMVEIGFTASYAIFVHEIDKNYIVGTWKFLQFAIVRTKNKILDIIKRTS